MSPLAVLLRILLCIALVLNGSVPMVHSAMAGKASQQAASTDPAVDRTSSHVTAHGKADMAMGEGGCHDDAPADAPPPSHGGDHGDDDGDCCNGDSGCSSTCAQHCAVSMPGIARLHLTLAPAAGPLPITVAAQPDPRLRDRIRPPIA
jgi:hypothetical protein